MLDPCIVDTLPFVKLVCRFFGSPQKCGGEADVPLPLQGSHFAQGTAKPGWEPCGFFSSQ